MENDVSTTLYANGSVWAVSTSTYTATDKLKAEDLDKDSGDILDIFKLGRKYLLPADVRVQIAGVRGKVNAFMERFGSPFFLRGAHFVPFKHTLIVKEGLEKIRAAHLEVGANLVEQYPSLKEEMLQNYPVLKDANWPTEEQILDKFAVRWIVFEVNESGVQTTDPADLIAAKAEFQAELKAEYDKLKDETLKDAHAALITACDTISKKIFETGDKITKTTIKKPLAVIEKYSTVAELFDLDDIKVKVAELKTTLEATNAKEVRDDWGIAKAFGDNLKKLANDIDDLSGYSADGSVKRQIKFKKAA
jgi:hypothetical protein